MGRQKKIKIQKRFIETNLQRTQLKAQLQPYGVDTTIRLHYSENALIDDMWYFQEHTRENSYVRKAYASERSPYSFVLVLRTPKEGVYPYTRIPVSGLHIMQTPLLKRFSGIIFE
jgi:hypothetical protein